MIRPAILEDGVEFVKLAHDFHLVAGYMVVPFDAQTVYDRFILALEQNMCFMAEKDGEIVGTILGVVAPSLVNKNVLTGCELIWWVKPEHRNTGCSIKLLKALESAAKSCGVVLWSMISLETQEPEKVGEMYMRLGYAKTENTWTRAFNANTKFPL